MREAKLISAVTTDGFPLSFDVSQESGLALEVHFPDRTYWGFESVGWNFTDLAVLAGSIMEYVSTHTLAQVRRRRYSSMVREADLATKIVKDSEGWGKKYSPARDDSLFNIFTPHDEEVTVRAFSCGHGCQGLQVDCERSDCRVFRVQAKSKVEQQRMIGRLCGWLLVHIASHPGHVVSTITSAQCETAIGATGVTISNRHVLRHGL